MTKILDSVEEGFLTDKAYIVRRVEQAADLDATFGTPGVRELTWGPFPAKVSSKVANDQRQPDRHVVEKQYSLSIACDLVQYRMPF
jgi:hypothetical protein